MPVIYEFDVNGKLVRTRCVGNVTLEEVVGHFATLQQDPNCPNYLDVLLDLAELTSLPNQNELRTVSQTIGKARPRVVFGSCAIVAPRDAVFGMMRMFEVFAQQHFRATHVFRAVSEAEKWLAAQEPNANQKLKRASG